mmetsp:Transcript_13278/g.27528  ORF Transcript_13278/g.27528 Transcript_13278/m.27528 type:complete len:520 (-) Transcript_13278:2538-4097(-)
MSKKRKAADSEMENSKSGETPEDAKTTVSEATVRPSIIVKLIRHAESANNQVYRDARYIYRGGTPEFDEKGWTDYVNTHRAADPSISDVGKLQAQALAKYLVPHICNQASQPVHVVTSPMRRTLETITPTLEGLTKEKAHASVLVNAFYHESEGCHTRNVPEDGMNPAKIKEMLSKEGDESISDPYESIQFTGFPNDPEKGWYSGAKGEETRAQSEERAAKFYLWLCEYLDEQLQSPTSDDRDDIFDAGVSIAGEEHEDEHDKSAGRIRKRRTCLLIGHADFMSLVLKRVVTGFGHMVEQKGIPHRCAFVHFNTGITEVEYFGKGRFLIMAHNQTPHFMPSEYSKLRTGGSLKDGWSYIIPNEPLNSEVKVAFDDEELDDHVKEQTQALKALYLKSESISTKQDPSLEVEEQQESKRSPSSPTKGVKHFIVHRGLQVVGCATYSEDTGVVSDVALRPSAGPNVMETLMQAVKSHKRTIGRSGSLLVFPRAGENKDIFKGMGFTEVEDATEKKLKMEMKH